MKLKQLSFTLMATLSAITHAYSAIDSRSRVPTDLILSSTNVAAGLNGMFQNKTMDFTHFKVLGMDDRGIYRFAGSDIPVASHQDLGVWDFKQIGTNPIYFGEWAKESRDPAGNYNKQADAATHSVFYIGDNADSHITHQQEWQHLMSPV